jgi:hypothetical protein
MVVWGFLSREYCRTERFYRRGSEDGQAGRGDCVLLNALPQTIGLGLFKTKQRIKMRLL